MGMIERMFQLMFGGGGNMVRDTVEVFRENAEAGSQRGAQVQMQAMREYGQEFAIPHQGWFDRFMDGVNRLPRPALALGTLGLFVAAMIDPLWFCYECKVLHWCPNRCGGCWVLSSHSILGHGIR